MCVSVLSVYVHGSSYWKEKTVGYSEDSFAHNTWAEVRVKNYKRVSNCVYENVCVCIYTRNGFTGIFHSLDLTGITSVDWKPKGA